MENKELPRACEYSERGQDTVERGCGCDGVHTHAHGNHHGCASGHDYDDHDCACGHAHDHERDDPPGCACGHDHARAAARGDHNCSHSHGCDDHHGCAHGNHHASGHDHPHDHHDHDCACGHDHARTNARGDHNCSHSHGCDDDHPRDHARRHGEEAVDNALVLSRSGRLAAPGPLTAGQAVERTKEVLLAVADAVAIEGIVPGHVKALLSHGDVRCTLSVTRNGVCDVLLPACRDAADWDVTVNIISVVKPPGDPSDLLDRVFL